MRKFTISTDRSGRKRIVEIRVYENAQAMRRAAVFDKWDKRLGQNRKGRDLTNAGAVTSPVFVMQLAKDGTAKHEAMCGVVRFAKGCIDTEVIAHEMTHMGLAIYSEDCSPDHPGDDMDNEEKFCYIVGDLTRKAWVKLWEAEQ